MDPKASLLISVSSAFSVRLMKTNFSINEPKNGVQPFGNDLRKAPGNVYPGDLAQRAWACGRLDRQGCDGKMDSSTMVQLGGTMNHSCRNWEAVAPLYACGHDEIRSCERLR